MRPSEKKITLPAYACLRCAHHWIPRITTKPKRCPNCKSPYWNKPLQKKKGR